ncbi:HGL082Cp [Eremothecium sinecaudum]|uniref:HGL082Cp n=1 Tax=Eremothecium sinecaudum TaxID=45286 RepID=A0A109V033_9SACH|nr:HGL082Cp [Eremothecium sinecaudum]AMD22258.1 HGL082Cp [Eremothecium sinecaudum]
MSEIRSYYDVISDLSCFESSDKVSFTREQLSELVQQEVDNRAARDDLSKSSIDFDASKRIPMHSYLGPLSAQDAEEASKHLGVYNLNHTLLGGYVPRNQLESLSSTDFAHYLHKVLECEGPLESYAKYVNVGRIPIGSVDPANESPVPLTARAPTQVQLPGSLGSAQGIGKTQTPSNSATPSIGTPPVVNTTIKKAGESHVKKVVLCKLCKKRFSGPRRFTEFSNHMCMKG